MIALVKPSNLGVSRLWKQRRSSMRYCLTCEKMRLFQFDHASGHSYCTTCHGYESTRYPVTHDIAEAIKLTHEENKLKVTLSPTPEDSETFGED
jgi:hypothetical protein